MVLLGKNTREKNTKTNLKYEREGDKIKLKYMYNIMDESCNVSLKNEFMNKLSLIYAPSSLLQNNVLQNEYDTISDLLVNFPFLCFAAIFS